MDYIIEPLIGAIIGCFTNYIAIKMLFRPYNKIYFFGIPIPLTPGIIPKRKSAIAKAIGNVVAMDLLDKNQIINVLSSDTAARKVADFIMNYIVYIPENLMLEKSIGDFFVDILIKKQDFKKIISQEIYDCINQKFNGNFAFKFISDKIIVGIVDSIGDKVQEFIKSDGSDFISKAINNEIYEISGMSVYEILLKYNFDISNINDLIVDKYKNIIHEKANFIFDNLDIASIIEQKVNSMNMVEFEKIVLNIMNKELKSIVYLGALIGFLIGLLNLII